jgi:hypothetical protein
VPLSQGAIYGVGLEGRTGSSVLLVGCRKDLDALSNKERERVAQRLRRFIGESSPFGRRLGIAKSGLKSLGVVKRIAEKLAYQSHSPDRGITLAVFGCLNDLDGLSPADNHAIWQYLQDNLQNLRSSEAYFLTEL